ncbi:MAG: Uma2 family endonuclease [Chloroflexota bacterium]
MDRDHTAGDVVAASVTWDDYMTRYAHDFYEWKDGAVIKMAPIHLAHDELSQYLSMLLRTYLSLRPVGMVRLAPFVMKLPNVNSSREPDLQVILNTNMDAFTPTGMLNAADIAIEIVSPESIKRDYEEKYAEYEQGGVTEYWLIDPIKQGAHIYRAREKGAYAGQPLVNGVYETNLLPGFKLDTALLWRDPLPDPLAIVKAVTDMLANPDNTTA